MNALCNCKTWNLGLLMLLLVPALALAMPTNDGPTVVAGPMAALNTPDRVVPTDRDCDCIQLVFVVDVTGSMGGAISNVAGGLGNILALADDQSCGNLEGAVVTFRDDVEVLVPMTANQADIVNAINSLTAMGGAGWPEASDEALKELVSTSDCLTYGSFDPNSWNADCCKVAVLVTDAPPGGCDDLYIPGIDDVAAQNIANALALYGVRVAAVHVTSFDYTDPDAQQIMINYATVTGGVYGLVQGDGTGTAAAIEQAILDCEGAGQTELCCTDSGCLTVLRGQCSTIGGYVVDDCADCETVSTEDKSWSSLKSLFH